MEGHKPFQVLNGKKASIPYFHFDKSSGDHQYWRLFSPSLERLEMPHIELSNSKLNSILLEEDFKDLDRRLQHIWNLHDRLHYGSSSFGIHSNILGSSLLVIFCRALIASFLSWQPWRPILHFHFLATKSFITNRISLNVLEFDRNLSINDRHFPIRKQSDKI